MKEALPTARPTPSVRLRTDKQIEQQQHASRPKIKIEDGFKHHAVPALRIVALGLDSTNPWGRTLYALSVFPYRNHKSKIGQSAINLGPLGAETVQEQPVLAPKAE